MEEKWKIIKEEKCEKRYVVVEGNLTKAPQLEEVNGYKIVKNMSVGCFQCLDKQWDLLNDMYSKEKQYGKNNDFINLRFWNKQAEIIDKYGNKGQRIILCGYLEKVQYEKAGETRCSYWMNVETFRIILEERNKERLTPQPLKSGKEEKKYWNGCDVGKFRI